MDTVTDFVDYNGSSVKSATYQSWKQKNLSKSYKKLYGIEKEYKWQDKNAEKECNKSILSLHIAAYENAIEVQNVTYMEKQSKQVLSFK
uniref:Uncharacterized protein n=1 Tax=Panagrolaimus sp. ES5 TaxID=591445 RepID=A0AC34FU99_9BILA